MMRHTSIASIILAAAACCAAAAQPASLTPLDMSIRAVKRATTPARDGSDLIMLAALRQMRDPSLQPLFQRMSGQGSNPQAQVHSLLALAELDEGGHVSTALIRQLQSPEGRLQAITAALADDRLSTAQCAELVAAPEVEPLAKLWLMAELIKDDGKSMDQQALASMVASPNIDVAGFASLLLLRTGDAEPFNAYTARFTEFKRISDATAIAQHRAGMFDVILQCTIEPACHWLQEQLDDPKVTDDVADQGLRALLAIDPDAATARWAQAVRSTSSPARLLRLSLIMLEADADRLAPGPAATYDLLIASDLELIRLLGEVGRAASSGGDVVKPLVDLVAADHPRATSWALDYASDLPAEQAAQVYTAAMDRVESAAGSGELRVTAAADAAARLYRINPDAVLSILAAAPDDSQLQESLLLGLTVTGDARAGGAASTLDRSGSTRADAVALILVARFAESLTPGDLQKLGVIASGGTRLSDTLQTQAAWLFIRHSNKIDAAMTALFDKRSED